MTTVLVQRDERTTAVENASHYWSYLVVSFGLLLIVVYRSYFWQESPWDLLALVILGGLVSTAHQAYHQVLGRRWLVVVALAMVVAAGLAAGIALLR
jgi:hypothetical protein